LEHGSRTYNLGNGRGFSVKQVIETAREVTGRPIATTIGPRRGGDPAVLVASSEKIRRELGWQPEFPSLEAIVQSAWDWHVRHPHGYNDDIPRPVDEAAPIPTLGIGEPQSPPLALWPAETFPPSLNV
jgi:UDP-glucose 4-epimerase